MRRLEAREVVNGGAYGLKLTDKVMRNSGRLLRRCRKMEEGRS